MTTSGPALALATGIGAHFTALRAYVNISDVLELLGRHEEAVEAAREGIALAHRVGLARSLGALPATWSASAAGPKRATGQPR